MEQTLNIDDSVFFQDQEKNDDKIEAFTATQVGATVFFIDPISEYYSINDALKMFDENKDLTSIPVEGEFGVNGLLVRSDLKNKKASIVNDFLEAKVESFVRKIDGSLNAQESIEKVIDLFLEKDRVTFFDDVPVYYMNRYFGITNFRRLSKKYYENRKLDMQQGRSLQQFLLSTSKLQDIGCTIDVYNKMAYSLGGDFFTVLKLNESLSLIASFDVAGKGVSGSLSTAIISSFFMTLKVAESLESMTPEKLVRLLNKTLFTQTTSDIFVTGIFVFLDKKSGKYIVYNCGHTQLLVQYDSSADIVEYSSSAPPLGIMDEYPDIDSLKQIIPLSNATRLFIFSDGLTDIRNIDGVEFGEVNLKKFLVDHGDTPLGELSGKLSITVDGFIGAAPQTDDITLIAFQADAAIVGQHLKGAEILSNLKKKTLVDSAYSANLRIVTRGRNDAETVRHAKFFASPEGFLLLVLKPANEMYSGYVYAQGTLQSFDTNQNFTCLDPETPLFGASMTVLQLISPALFQDMELLEFAERAGVGDNQCYCRVQSPHGLWGLTIDTDHFLPSKKEYIDGSGKVTRVVEFKNWLGQGNGYIPSEVKCLDTASGDSLTEISFANVKPVKLKQTAFKPEKITEVIAEIRNPQ